MKSGIRPHLTSLDALLEDVQPHDFLNHMIFYYLRSGEKPSLDHKEGETFQGTAGDN